MKEINPYNVTDRVRFRNVDKTLTLTVRADAGALVIGMKRVQELLLHLSDDSTADDQMQAARSFAETIFGPDQSVKLCDFYGDAITIVNVCTIYFRERLAKKITKAQKIKRKKK